MSLTNVSNQSIPFWREDLVSAWGRIIPIIASASKSIFGRNWPSTGPNSETVARHLLQSRRAWARVEENNIYLLTGNYSLRLHIKVLSESPKLWLNFVEYATNMHRKKMLENGVQIAHEGIKILTPQQMNSIERESSFWESGEYTHALKRIIVSGQPVMGRVTKQLEEENKVSSGQSTAIDALKGFVDAEFEQEEQIAQQTPGFYFSRLKAVSRPAVRRQFYELELVDSDYERFLELKPSMLTPADEMGNPSDVRFEVVDEQPDQNRSIILVSIENQTESVQLPESGQLLLSALPTLRNVRNEVLEALLERRCPNHWLMPLLADEYEAPVAESEEVNLPPSEYPPTASQMKAINMGAGAKDYCMVLGPPGTGKTSIILSWVRHFVNQGMRVLVTSQNNKAVDNVLEKLSQEGEFECLRLGNESKITSTLQDIMLDNKAKERV